MTKIEEIEGILKKNMEGMIKQIGLLDSLQSYLKSPKKTKSLLERSRVYAFFS